MACIVDNFGYGPACGLLDSIESAADSYDWHFFSTGQALSLLARCMPRASRTDLNPRDRGVWGHLLDSLAPEPDPIVVVSYPPLVAFLLQHGRTVVHIDQLAWMWEADERLPELAPAATRGLRQVVQWYFGASPVHDYCGTEVRPILPLDISEIPCRCPDPSRVLLAFGGMAVAGVSDGSDPYAAWMTDRVMKALDQTLNDARIVVVGGSPTFIAAARHRYPGVTFLAGLARREYLALLAASGHQILTPGLASIYEADALRLAPLFLPGSHKSMVLQSADLVARGYARTGEWGWQRSLVAAIRHEPEEQILVELAREIRASLRDPSAASALVERVSDYLLEDPGPPLKLNVPKGLPTSQATVELMLSLSSIVAG
ncbi:MAG TPA: hypothetical protein VGK51_12550 [Actinomycetota bacterium]